MKVILRIFLLAFLFTGTFSQEFDLGDALDDPPPKVTPKPKEEPKAPPPKLDDGDLNLLDAFGEDPPVEKPKKPTSGGTGDFSLDLEDALGPEDPKKPAENPSKPGGGGGSFSDSDLFDVNNNGGYEPEGGPSNGGNSGYDSNDGAEQPKDPDLPWDQILKMINANMPEEFFMWMANVKQTLLPLLERAMDLLHAVP